MLFKCPNGVLAVFVSDSCSFQDSEAGFPSHGLILIPVGTGWPFIRPWAADASLLLTNAWSKQ